MSVKILTPLSLSVVKQLVLIFMSGLGIYKFIKWDISIKIVIFPCELDGLCCLEVIYSLTDISFMHFNPADTNDCVWTAKV